MTEEQINYHRAADAVAKMTEQLLMLKMQMPVNLAIALQSTASSLDAAQEELSRWQARLEQSVDIGA